MHPPSSTIVTVPRSGIRRIYDEAAQYPDCIRLEVGEPSFATPDHVKAAAARAMAEDFTKYTPNAGIAELREALVHKLATRNGIEARADDIIVTNGAVASIFTTLAALVNPGDEVLVADPSWPNYVQMVRLLGAVPVYYPLRLSDDLVPRVADIESVISPRTKVIIINSPGNPSGAIIGAEALAQIIAVARQHDLWVISDEVYDEIWFDTPPVSAQPLDTDGRVISVFSFSKTYSMTGWRVGYLVGQPEIVAHVLRAQEPTTSCINSIAQRAAVAAATGDQQCVADMRAEYASNARLATGLLDAHAMSYSRPTGAFYLMVDITGSGLSDLDFCSRMIHDKRVAVVPGSAFGEGSARFVRVSLASAAPDLTTGLERLAEAVTEWSVT
jgi:aspartate/methionine/tyrosine aminotransferase